MDVDDDDRHAVPTAALKSGASRHNMDGNNESVVHQRRRVNPESLALRLGPDLVRDLDALITPGNTEMPSFAIRKELQERYSIDRRHIYDYFHSRGLRVVKEDKHGNLVPAKDFATTPMPNLRPLRQAPLKITRSYPSSYPVETERKLVKPHGVTKPKPGRPKKNPPTNPKIDLLTSETINSAVTNVCVSEHPFPSAVAKPTYVSVNPLLPSNPPASVVEEDRNCTLSPVINPLDDSFSVSRAIGDIAYAYRHKLVFERMQELTEYPAKLAIVDNQSLSSPCSASTRGLLLPHVKPLTRDERHAIYETLSESLGPAHGIQECQGTYRKHMEARAKLYFEGLLSAPYNHAQQPTRTNALLDRKHPSGTNEFSHWLSETGLLKHDGTNSSPRFHPGHRNANVAKPLDGATDKQFRQRFDLHRLQTLDDLFPCPAGNWYNHDPFTDSPIVDTQEITRMTTHTRDVIDECSTGDRSLFSVMSSSATETRQTTQPHFHGLSGFSGSQEFKMRMPPAEPDHHPQWLEHDVHVAHPKQHLALSGTLRASRNLSNTTRTRLPSRSPRKTNMDRIRTRPVTSHDARRRTTSAAGDI